MQEYRRLHRLVYLIVFCLILGLLAEAAMAQPDPGVRGPRAVTRQEYTMGDTAFSLSGFPGRIEITGSVTYPTDMSDGPFPVVVFLHGRHATCFQGGSAFLEWPCTGSRQPIPSYRGYDYLADVLASNGYITISISANGISARDNSVSDLGMDARARLMQRHLDLWNDINTTGQPAELTITPGPPFGNRFVGRLDLTNVGTMGHSRGGEGVVQHYIYNARLGSPYGINAVFPLAPVDFNRPIINNVPLAVLLPYCDGDVSDLQGVHFYDDARYNVRGDVAAKHTVLVMGANHNFYNTIWTPGGFSAGTSDDWLAFISGGPADSHCGSVPGNQRLTAAQQRGTALAYVAGFFRLYLGFEDFFFQFTGDTPPPPSATTDSIFVSYHAPDDPASRRDVNRLLTASNLRVNTLGGVVQQRGLTPNDLCGGPAPQPAQCLPNQPTTRQPHTTPSARSSLRGLSQLRFGWRGAFSDGEGAAGSSEIFGGRPWIHLESIPDGPEGAGGMPRPGDVSNFLALQFRAGVNFSDDRNPLAMPQDVSVTLTDGAGNSSTALVSDWSNALFYPPGRITPITPVPKVLLNTIRIPLYAFDNVDLTRVRTITFTFDQTDSGALLITDIAFAY